MDDLVTIDTIINWLKEQVEKKVPISPHLWVDAALKMTVLLGSEHDRLYDLQSWVAQEKVNYIDNNDSVAKANAKVQTGKNYNLMKKQEAKIGRIEEMIRVAKLQARLKDNEWQAQ